MKHSPRIALCLSGQPRYLDFGYQFLYENIINKYNVDVFSHIWFDDNLTGTDIEFSIPYNRFHKWEKNADKKFLSLYKPKKYIFEPPKTFSAEPFLGANFELATPSNVLSMFYSLKQANNLKCEFEKENNFEYDFVIRARTDIILLTRLDFTTLDKHKIYCYEVEQQTVLDNVPLCNDQFAIGGSPVMNTYSQLYDLYEYYWKTYRPPSMVPERILTTHLFYSKIPVQCCNSTQLYVNIYKG